MRDDHFANIVRHLSNLHIPGARPNVCILSTPRSGSTWLMELILSQPGFKPCNEPDNIRKAMVARRLGLTEWKDLYDDEHLQELGSYFNSFLHNRFSAAFKNLRPGQPFYRPVTRRIVFKLLHSCEHRVDWLQQALHARIVLLVRHPIPVSMSREDLPRLATFLKSDYRKFLSVDQQRLAGQLLQRGAQQEKAVLDWCLQNAVPLQHFRDRVLLVTYEQLVLQPDPVLKALADFLDLDSVEDMRAQINRPSLSVSKSKADTANYLTQQQRGELADKRWLVEKWRSKISDDYERKLMNIVAAIGIDIYRRGECLPADEYWIS